MALGLARPKREVKHYDYHQMLDIREGLIALGLLLGRHYNEWKDKYIFYNQLKVAYQGIYEEIMKKIGGPL